MFDLISNSRPVSRLLLLEKAVSWIANRKRMFPRYLLSLVLCLLMVPASHAAFKMRPSFYDRAIAELPTPELKSPLAQKQLPEARIGLMQPVEGPRVRVIVSPERKYQLGTRLLIVGGIFMLAGGALIAWGAAHQNPHDHADTSGDMAQIFGAIGCIGGLFGFIGPGIYLHLRYR